MRILFLLHRYLGIAGSLVLLLWSLSGIVMMYKQYPQLSDIDQIQLLENLAFQDCCELKYLTFLARDFSAASVEMLGDTPLVRLQTTDNELLSYALRSGVFINAISEQRAYVLANKLLNDHLAGAKILQLQSIHSDQWTIDSQYHPHRPLYKFTIDDASRTEFYLSSYNGELVQLTTKPQRMWGYLGPVVHWVFPRFLRENSNLWRNLVIFLSVLGIFLTVTGLMVGWKQVKSRGSQITLSRWSPYQGVHFFHHYLGLIFGLLTLVWVSSGLLSMNPQGLLIASDSKVESLRLQGRDFDIEALALVLADADFQRVAEQYVRVDFSMLDGQLSMVGISDDGSRYSLHRRSYRPVAVADDLLNRLAEQLQPEFAIASRQLLLAADNYYYAQHQSVEFPVYRVIIDDPQGSRYYLSPVSGQIKLKVDSSTRWYRWLFYAVHRMDFIPLARFSSVREYFMIVLLVGVVMLCGTGTWLAVRRLLR